MEFLYFIQRSDRIFTGDPVGRSPRFFNFRNDVLPVRFRRARLRTRLSAQYRARGCRRSDFVGSADSSDAGQITRIDVPD
ncbi:hypothetical protein [Burkholderia sp. BCC1972]|uniref:hypothetical protein n=1 Tax=Burkholderia sp. BCC1972 TaxID=2817438 RepID=UPI002ABD8F93|nr:hypothetical protein [Burkholderia sp. BCC1972]